MIGFWDFIQLVKRMRDAQRAYFRTRSKQALVESKQIEKEVDDHINLFLNDAADEAEQDHELGEDEGAI